MEPEPRSSSLNPIPHDPDEIDDPIPPSPIRIARRALALAAITARAVVEQVEPDQTPIERERQHESIITWATKVAVIEELEPEEKEILQSPIGSLSERTCINSSWRIEGLAVLAWALNLIEQPLYDESVDTGLLLNTLYVSAQEIINAPNLRTELEILSYHNQLWSLHWRLRDYSVNSEIMDFKKVGQEIWFGPLDTSMFKMIDGDLAISGRRIDKAPTEIFSHVLSLARERHHAATWLLGYNPIYSEIDAST